MTWVDYLIIAAVAVVCLWVLFRRKKPSGCCGNCGSCQGGCCKK